MRPTTKTLLTLLTLCLALLPATGRAADAELIGAYLDGGYGWDSEVRFFALRYQGRLNKGEVERQAWAVVQRLNKEDRSLKAPYFDEIHRFPSPNVRIDPGQVFVMGRYDQETNKWCWLAADRSSYLTNGKRGSKSPEANFYWSDRWNTMRVDYRPGYYDGNYWSYSIWKN